MEENEIVEDNRSIAEMFFEGIIEKEPEKEPEVEPEKEKEPEKEVETGEHEIPAKEPVVEPPVITEPKKLWTPEFETEINDLLSQKYQYKSFSADQKALAYIAAQNPELDEKELLFLAATDYGIGVDELPEAELTDAQVIELRKQGIQKKKLLSQADKYFQERANGIQLPELPSLEDLDPDYKVYKTEREQQVAKQNQQAQLYAQTVQHIETNAKTITDIKEPIEIDIDEGKFTLDVNFKLDEAKQKKLVDYAKQYSPSEDEVTKFTDTQTGKFDYAGYLKSLAPNVFAKEMVASGIKQALAKDRTNFIEKELKNSTLRNNDVSQAVEKKHEAWEAWPFGK